MTTPRKMPRGIQQIERTNKDGTKIVKYRVQIKSKGFACDRLFDEFEEAKEFWLVTKSRTGQRQVTLLAMERAKQQGEFLEQVQSPSFDQYIRKYFERYIDPKYKQWLTKDKYKTPEGKFKLRQRSAEFSFYRTIKSTRIRPYSKEKADAVTVMPDGKQVNVSQLKFNKPRKGYIDFGTLKPREITGFEINEYINERLKTVRASSVESELTKISNVFKKLKYLDPSLADLPNPVLQADRDLLKAHKKSDPPTRTVKRLSEEDKSRLFEALNKRENKELFNAIKFMLMTGLRRSEMVLLHSSNCFSNYIHIQNNKSNRPRTVYLMPEAREILTEQLAHKYSDGRAFNFVSVTSFASQFKKCMKKHGLEHIKPHLMRKEFISSMVEKLGRQNSLILATILGNDVRYLENQVGKLPIEQPINDQRDLLSQVGHRDSRITQKHYLEINLASDSSTTDGSTS